MQKDENYKRIMLVAAGSAMAAVAGNCVSCLDTVARELKAAGATHEEIHGAVEIALTVREKPARIGKETADKLTGEPLEVVASA